MVPSTTLLGSSRWSACRFRSSGSRRCRWSFSTQRSSLLSGAVLTETIFAWPGLGRYAYQSAVTNDFPAIMGVTFVIALIYILVNLVVDMAYVMLDPQIRYS